MEKEKLITLKEAAELSGYAPDYIGQLIRKGKLPGKQVYANVAWVTTADAVREYMEDRSLPREQKQQKEDLRQTTQENISDTLDESISETVTPIVGEFKPDPQSSEQYIEIEILERALHILSLVGLVLVSMLLPILLYIFAVSVDHSLELRNTAHAYASAHINA